MFLLENYTNPKTQRRRNKSHKRREDLAATTTVSPSFDALALVATRGTATATAAASEICSPVCPSSTLVNATTFLLQQQDNEEKNHQQQQHKHHSHQRFHKSHLNDRKSMKSIKYFHYMTLPWRISNIDLWITTKATSSLTLSTTSSSSMPSTLLGSASTATATGSASSSSSYIGTKTPASPPSPPSTPPPATTTRRKSTSLSPLPSPLPPPTPPPPSSNCHQYCPIAAATSSSCNNFRSISRRHLLLILMLLLFVCLVNTSSVKAAEGLLGDLQSCSNEGEEIHVSIKNSKCFKCSCQNGFVKCEGSCPPIEDCYLLDRKTSDSCCSKCKGCIFRGIPYVSGSEWTDPDDSCRSYKCVGGVVTETIMKCYTQCDDSQLTKPRPGECCPTCQGCKINGQIVLEGQEVVASIDDRCLVCQCSGQQLTCAKKACPVLQCPITKQKLHPNECCPRCTEQREFMPLAGGKCFFNNKIYYDKMQFMPDRCTNCTCANGSSICHRKTCPILECAPEYQEMDGCCPRCITSEVRAECIKNGISYQNNETWNFGPCRSCRCTDGNIRCSEMRCSAVKCRSNEELKVLPGECCPKCIETAGTCTVFGDPHFKTFDGKFFSFQGSCKYLLASDCHDHTFSIRLTNDGRQTKRSSWAKTVTLKLQGGTRVNLGQKQRVKVNGSRVALPYSSGPITSIERLRESIMLKTELGLSIEWDGNNYLQVTAPSTYKRRLCGLCGNYNGLARDDLTSRDGYNHTEVWRFANSWKVGGPKACSRKQENIAVDPTCKQRKSNAMCRPLRESEVFGFCDSRVNPNNYIESCKMDVCECPTGMCHCDSFAAYARECQRLGVPLPNWRLSTSCPHGMWKRDFNTTLQILRHNPYYGDLSFLEYPHRQRPPNRRRKLERQQHHNNEFLPRDFITKHVPKNLLISKSPDRTPPPLH